MLARSSDTPQPGNDLTEAEQVNGEPSARGTVQPMRQAKTELHEFLTHTRVRIRAIAQAVAEYNAIEDAKAAAKHAADQEELDRLRQVADAKSTAEPMTKQAGAESDATSAQDFDQTNVSSMFDESRDPLIEELIPDRAVSQVSPQPSQVVNDSLAVTSVLQGEDELPSMVDPAISRQELPSSSPLTADGVDPFERLNAIKQRLAKQIENS